MERENIARGVWFDAVKDEKFKGNRISVNFITELDEETVSGNAIVPFVLKRGKSFTELNRSLDEMYGADLYAEASAFGKYQTLTLEIIGIGDKYALNGEKLSEECAKLLDKLIFEPNITDGEFGKLDVELEKNNLINAIEAEINDKRTYALGRCAEIMFKGEPYGIKKCGVTQKALEITPKSAAEAYYRIIDKADIEILFLGSGDADGVKSVFEKRFENMKRDPINIDFSSRKVPDRKVIEKEETMDINQGKLVMAFRTNDSDTREKRMAIQLMNAMFGATPFSKLFVNVREKESLCYYCVSRFDRKTNVMTVDSGIEFGNFEKAKDGIKKQLEYMKNGVFGDEDIAQAKLYMQNAYKTVEDSLGGIEGWRLSQILCGGNETPLKSAEDIVKVSREDIIKAARSFELDTVYFLKGTEAERNADE